MPSTEQKKLVAHVIAETSSGYNNASGIVVAPGRVLTARHVLEGASTNPEIRLCVLGPAKWIPAKVCWDGRSSNRDVAVLEFDPDQLTPASREICKNHSNRLINTGPWGSQARWGSFGLPVLGWRTPKAGSKPIPEPTGLVGSTGSLNPAGDLNLHANALPTVAEAWMGASGSGVFIDHGLRAVIVEAVRDAPNMLRALWIKPLLDLPSFREAILWSPERNWVATLEKDIGALLSRPDMVGLCERLAADRKLEGKDPKEVAKALIDLSAFDLLLVADRVGNGLVGDGTAGQDEEAKMAGVLEQIVEDGLAAKLGTALLSRVMLSAQAGAGDEFVELPCVQIVLAECYNAGLDGRRPELRDVPPADQSGDDELWKDVRREYPLWPDICVPLAPAVGFVEATAWVKTALEHLALALKVPDIQRSRSQKDLAETVNDKLETLALAGQAVPKRWYLVYPDGEDPAPARKLRELLPELRICIMTRSEDREERKAVERLATAMTQFLDRKRKRANRR